MNRYNCDFNQQNFFAYSNHAIGYKNHGTLQKLAKCKGNLKNFNSVKIEVNSSDKFWFQKLV